jgi:hypothetical protein
MRVNPSDAAVGGVKTTPMSSPPPHSRGVISVVQPDLPVTGANPDGTDSKFCFDLTFLAEVAVGGAHYNANANVTARVPSDTTPSAPVPDADCPVDHRDAVVKTYAANTSGPIGDAIFSVMFDG